MYLHMFFSFCFVSFPLCMLICTSVRYLMFNKEEKKIMTKFFAIKNPRNSPIHHGITLYTVVRNSTLRTVIWKWVYFYALMVWKHTAVSRVYNLNTFCWFFLSFFRFRWRLSLRLCAFVLTFDTTREAN